MLPLNIVVIAFPQGNKLTDFGTLYPATFYYIPNFP